MSKLNNQEVINIIESEGIGYAVTEYLSSTSIDDKELAQMWKEVSTLLKSILEYLEIDN